jgi:hypothetical protein
MKSEVADLVTEPWYMWPDSFNAGPEDVLALVEVAEAAHEYATLVFAPQLAPISELPDFRSPSQCLRDEADRLGAVEAATARLEQALTRFGFGGQGG